MILWHDNIINSNIDYDDIISKIVDNDNYYSAPLDLHTTYQMDDIINCYLDVLPLGFRELRTMYVSTPKNLDPKHSATKKNMKDFDYVLNHIENNYSGSLRDSSLWYLNICKERLI